MNNIPYDNNYNYDSTDYSAILQQLTGPIRYRITNAYMFVAVLNQNQETLCSLIASLLHMKREQVESVKIQNPIILGEVMEEKDCVLDLYVLLNNQTRINLELQLRDEHNWDDRSVYYLGRRLCDLKEGEDYTHLKPLIQIGILDFDYPEGNQEFYQQYALMNIKTHRIYSDKVRLHVLSLKQIGNATQEDRASGLYEWAKVFKATTWEELKALAKENKTIEKTIVTMAQLSEDEKIRQQCERWEKYERDKISAIAYGERRGYEKGMAVGKERGHADGLLEGIEMGKEAGMEQKLVLLVCRKLRKGKTVNAIAEELEEDISLISHICEAAAQYAPDYDEECVCQALSAANDQ